MARAIRCARSIPARATEFDPFQLDELRQDQEQEALRFQPEEWGMRRGTEDRDYMFLNLGPNHPSAHGAFRIVLQLDGEEIVDCVPDIGYHHRGAEKMGERQSWHCYIPYTDRIDYLGGVMNNLPYVLALEKLAGIEVPDRVKTIRVMLAEFFRILSHLLYYGTFCQDVGAMSPVFYMFVDRQKGYDVIEAITGFRMHPAWFRIGGLAHDLPIGWEKKVREFVEWLPKRLERIPQGDPRRTRSWSARSRGVAHYDTAQALEWGVTGPGLRATGCDFDLRKARPYSGYENFDFDVPVGTRGDVVRTHAGARRGDPPIAAHRRTVPEQHAGRSVQGRSSADVSAAERTHAEGHRNADHALPRRVVGTGDAGRRNVADDRSDERHQRATT